MKRFGVWIVTLAFAGSLASPAEAFTSVTKATPIGISASGVTPTSSLAAIVVGQNTADVVVPSPTFGTSGNTFRNSGAAIRVSVNTNLAANRVIIYTDNLGAAAVPKFCKNTALGNDGGGLVGVTDCTETVPLVWGIGVTGVTATSDPKVFTGTSANTAYVFSPNANGPGASNAVFVTDRAHVVSFTQTNSTLDNEAMKKCSDNTPVTNTTGDGLYPQMFGAAGANSDLCDQTSGAVVSQELSKNIAVVAFSCFGTTCNVPNLATAAADDSIRMSGPFYLPLGADFRFSSGQQFGTNTLTVELVTQ